MRLPVSKKAAALTLSLLSLGALAEEKFAPFVLEGYQRFSAPRLITNGRYEEIIAQDAKRLASARIDVETSTNLCVSYIKTSQFGLARTACDAAIAAALDGRQSDSARFPRSTQEHWREVARGYSNRAVLNWYTGARDDAATDMAAAARYAPTASFVVRNMAAMKARSGAAAVARS